MFPTIAHKPKLKQVRINSTLINDRYITGQIKRRGITAYDIIGAPSIDPEPDNRAKPYHERIRCNRFKSQHWDHRLCELLTDGEFDPANPYRNLTIPVKDLVR